VSRKIYLRKWKTTFYVVEISKISNDRKLFLKISAAVQLGNNFNETV
jgi:hypothetical protein